MRKKLRNVLAPMLTMLLILQSVMPGVMAENEQMVENADNAVTTEVIETPAQDPVADPPVKPADKPLPEEPTEPEQPVVPEAPTEPEVPEEPETIYVWLDDPLLTEATFKNATCDTAPLLKLQPLRDHWATEKVEISDELGNVNYHFDLNIAAGSTVWIKVTFWENHALDGSGFHKWNAGPGEREALLKVEFAPAPTEDDCTTKLTLPAPVTVVDETGENDPTVDIAAIAQVSGVESVVVEGDVVAGDDVDVRVAFEHRHALDTTVGSDWEEDANGDAIFTLSIPEEDADAEDAVEAEGTPEGDADEEAVEEERDEADELIQVTLPAPEVIVDETTGEETDVNTDAIASVEGVEIVIVEEPSGEAAVEGPSLMAASANAGDEEEQLLVRVTFEDDAELDEDNSDRGWQAQEDGSAIFPLSLSGGFMPMAVDQSASGITGFTIDPNTITDFSQIVDFSFTYTVMPPSGQSLATGDGFDFFLDGFSDIGRTFFDSEDSQIDLELGSVVIGYVEIDELGHGRLVLNDEVAGEAGVTGTFRFGGDAQWAEDLQEEDGRTLPFTVEQTDKDDLVAGLTIPGTGSQEPDPNPDPGTEPGKGGYWTTGDQGRSDKENALYWDITAPDGPASRAVLTDSYAARVDDAVWTFDCAEGTFEYVILDEGDAESIDVACVDGKVTITIGAYSEGEEPVVRVFASIAEDQVVAPLPEDGTLRFWNEVTSTVWHADDDPDEDDPFGTGTAEHPIWQSGVPGDGHNYDPTKSFTWDGNNRTTSWAMENDGSKFRWNVRGPAGPVDGVTFTDTAPEGWVFDCSPGNFGYLDASWSGGNPTSMSIDCATDGSSITVTFGAYMEPHDWTAPGFWVNAYQTADQPEYLRDTLLFENTVTTETLPYQSQPDAATVSGEDDARGRQTPAPEPSTAVSKDSRLTGNDGGQYRPAGALEWKITLPPGPNGGVSVEDISKTNWDFVCPDDLQTMISGDANATPEIVCSPELLRVTYPAGYSTGTPVITIRANMLVEWDGVPENANTFENTANIRVTDYLEITKWNDGPGFRDVVANDSITQSKYASGTGEFIVGEFEVSVGDYVWLDLNRDGLQDDNEPPVPGVQVELLNEDGTVVLQTTTTNGSGYYEFLNLQSNEQYQLRLTPPATMPAGTEWWSGLELDGWTTTGGGDEQLNEVDGGWIANDSNVVPGEGATGTISFKAPDMGANNGGDFDLTDNSTLDGGLVLPLVSVGDFVWFDYNRDGEQGDPAVEPGIDGINVTITGPDGFSDSTTTADGGYYYFTDLEPNTQYTITFEMPPDYDGWTTRGDNKDDPTLADPDSWIDGDSDVLPNEDPATASVTFTTPSDGNNQIGPGQSDNPNLDAGVVRLVSIGDYVWYDTNNDGIQGDDEDAAPGVSVTISGPEGFTETMLTDENGHYFFTGLTPGESYTLEFTAPDGYIWTHSNVGDDDAEDSDVVVDHYLDQVGTVEFTIPVDAAGGNQPLPGQTYVRDMADNPTFDGGLVQLVSVGDYVWFDYDQDGVQNTHPREFPVENVTVRLFEADGTTPVTDLAGNPRVTTTDAAGFYSFDNLFPSTDYVLVFEQPEEYDGWTEQGAGDSDALDSNADANGRVPFTSPDSGSNSATTPDEPTLDAGLVINTVSIGDYVWYDTNLDGIQDAGEPVAADIPVTLYTADGEQVGDPTVTDENGFYSFTGLEQNTDYYLIFEAPEGYSWTKLNQGGDEADSDVVTEYLTDREGQIDFTSPLYGANMPWPGDVYDGDLILADDPTLDGGLVKLVSVGDYVWFDFNQDGIQNEGPEFGIPGVTVTLFDKDGNQVGEPTETDELGYYGFKDLYPGGVYTIVIEQPDNYDGWTEPRQEPTGHLDSDVNEDGEIFFVAPLTQTGQNLIGQNVADDMTRDAGVIIETVSIGDYVWFDTNLNGIQDDGEPAAEGVLVTLYDAEGNQVGDPVRTDANGFYFFTDLEPLATYTLEFEAPEGYAWTQSNAGDDDTIDSDVVVNHFMDRVGIIVEFETPEFGANKPWPTETYVADMADDPTLDGGLVKLVSVGDYVWFDFNRNGLQDDDVQHEVPVAGVKVELYHVVDGEREFIAETVTDADGLYGFQNLYPGNQYVLKFEQPEKYDGWTQQDVGGVDNDWIDSDVDPATGEIFFVAPPHQNMDNVIWPVGQPDDPTRDAGLIITRVSIGDYVWYDENRDGIQNPGEPGVPDVTVIIYGPDGEEVDRTTTDPDGYYEFLDLEPDTEYTLEFEKPTDYTEWTSPNEGDDPANDSDVDPNGRVTVITPEFGRNESGPENTDDPTIDAGLVRLISIGDYVWYDANRDGVQDADEVPVAGVTVTLYGPDGEVAGTTTTDEDGYYYFQNLFPDTEYTLVFEKPADYTAWTIQGAADNAATDSDVNSNGVVTFTSPSTGNNLIGPDATDNPTLDAGLVRLVSIGDYVWYDANKNGIQDPDEDPAPGIRVHLYQGERLIGSTVTDENGYYYFQDLFPDTDYTLVFEKPEGYNWTTQGAGDDRGMDSDVSASGVVTFTSPSTGNNLIGPDATDNPTLDAGLVEIDPEDPDDPTDPVDPKKPGKEKPVEVKELPSTGAGSETNGLSMILASMAGLMLAAVAFRMNAFRRS